MTMRAPLVCAALAASLAGSLSALAAEPGPDTLPINVIAVKTDDADDQAEALTKALRASVRTMPGWSLGEGDYSLEVLILSLKCAEPPDASCQSRIADQIKADRYVWGSLKKKGANVAGELNFWVRGKGTQKVSLDYSANLTEANEEALRKVATDAMLQLTGGAPKGSIHIKAGSVNGQVFIDGQPMGALTAGDGTFVIPSGSHRIVVKAKGYGDVETAVVVRPNVTAEVAAVPMKAEVHTASNTRRIGGYVGIGAGVVLGGLGIMSSLQVNGVQNNSEFIAYRQAQPASPSRCNDANGTGQFNQPNGDIVSLCSKASTFQVMQFIFYPLAIVSAGAGVYLLSTSRSSGVAPTTTGLQVDPQMGPGGGKLDLSYRW
jgi:hypothetical protein